MKKLKLKKMLSFLLAVAMLMSAVPEVAFAATGEESDDSVTVTFAVSYGANKFYNATNSGTVLIPQEITIPYFDLGLYGLEEYYYNPECYTGGGQCAGTKEDAEGVVTTMHAFIYATEVFYCGIDPEDAGKGELADNLSDYISWMGCAGSSFMDFWDHGSNLNYYLNYAYPLGSAGWGSTSDQQALSDGDVVSIHLIEDWSVWGSRFGFFAVNDEDGEYTEEDTIDRAIVSQGDEVTLTLYRTAISWSDYITRYEATEGVTLSWADDSTISSDVQEWNHEEFAGMEEYAYTDDEGKITLDTSELEPGTYYIAAEGDVDYNNGLEIAPAVFELTVTENKDKAAAKAVEEKIAALGDVTLEKGEVIAEARKAYDALTETQKNLVTNYAVLTDAETEIAQLKQEAEEKAKEEAANKAAAKAVEEKIAGLGAITLESEEAVVEARKAYEALIEVQKNLVTNYGVLTEAETVVAQLKAEAEEKAKAEAEAKAKEEAANKAAAKAVEEKIADLGTVNLESEKAVTEARKAYDALTETQKNLVTNYNVLTEAETVLTQLKAEAEEKEKTEAEKAKEEAANKAAAKVAEEKIATLGTVTLESEEAVAEARKAYEALTEAQKNFVTNYNVLTEAETTLAQLKAEAEEQAKAEEKAKEEKAKEEAANKAAAKVVEEKIAGFGTVTLESEEAVTEARKAYEALTEVQKNLVTNYAVLTEAETALVQLKAEAEEQAKAEEKAKEEKAKEEATNKAAAKAVEEKIAELGTVTLESEEAVTEARKAYEALTEVQKNLVTNYNVLTEAETALVQLKTEEQARAEEQAKAEEKVKEEKAKAEAANKAAAKAVEEKIAAIGTVSLKSETKIKEARKAYDELSTEQKKYVSSASEKALTNAEKTFAKQKAEVKKGKKVTVGTNIYKITKDSVKTGTVEFVGTTKKTQKTIAVPGTVKIYDVTYKVTSIGSKAFNKCSKVTKITLAENVTKIGANAFKDCTKLKSITIKSTKMTSKTIHKNAFKGVSKKTTIKVPASKKKAYAKLYKKCGLNKNVKIK